MEIVKKSTRDFKEVNFNNLSDRELFDLMDDKDQIKIAKKAFGIIYSRYASEVKSKSMQLLRYRSDREDISNTIVQDTFTKAFTKSQTFDRDKKAIFWLFGIAQYILNDILRDFDEKIVFVEEYYENEEFDEDQFELDEIDIDENNDPETFSSERLAFDEAWNKLNPLEQEVLRTHFRFYDVDLDSKNQHLPKDEKEIICRIHKISDPNYLSKVRKRAIKKLYKNCNKPIDI